MSRRPSLLEVHKEIFKSVPGAGWSLVRVLVMSGVLRSIPVLLSIIMSYLVDSRMAHSGSTIMERVLLVLPFALGTFYVSLKAFEVVLNFLQRSYIILIMTHIASGMSQTAFRRLSELPTSILAGKDSKEWASLLNKRSDIINGIALLHSYLIPLFIELFVSASFLLLTEQFWQSAVFFSAMLVVGAFRLKATTPLIDSLTKLMKTQSSLVFKSQEMISKMHLARIFGSEDFLVSLRAREEENEMRLYRRYKFALGFMDVFQDMLLTATLIAVFLVGLGDVESGKLGVGLFVASFGVVSSGLFQLKNSFFAFDGIFTMLTSLKPHMEIASLSCEYPKEKHSEPLLGQGGVSVKDICFSYGSGDVLKKVSFRLQPGEKVFLVGLSGAGKSTLMKILLGLQKPSSGTMLFDNGVSAEHAFGFVPQELELFEDSVRNNLLLGKPSAAEDEMWTSLSRVNLREKVSAKGLDSQVSDFSGGERQRLAIARSLIAGKDFIVLDEPTSALDLSNEKVVISELMSDASLSAIISIHRLHSIPFGARVIVLDKGEIAQDGTCSALSSEPGLFSDLLSHSPQEDSAP